tara:strand:- start:4381 stop:5499 length:1119 start_codon:yes stop_codon:yes gene_type:complete
MLTNFVNYSIILALLSYLAFFRQIRLEIILLLAVISLLPFFLSSILPAGYLSDVLTYTHYAQRYRSEIGLHDLNISAYEYRSYDSFYLLGNPTGIIYGYLIPLPFVDNIYSLGFFNRFVYIIFIAYLILKKKVDGLLLYFLILYPSMILYTNVALRDTLILVIILLTIIFLVEKKLFLCFLLLVPLFFLRPVNSYLLLPIYIVYSVFFYDMKPAKKFFLLLLISIAITILSILYLDNIIQTLNNYRIVRGREDGIEVDNIILANNVYELIKISFASLPNFFIEPRITNFSNIFQLLQAVENLIILFFIVSLFLYSFKLGKLKALFWILSLIFIAAVYGYVQSNVGALSRYKFVFIVMYIFAIFYEKSKIKIV